MWITIRNTSGSAIWSGEAATMCVAVSTARKRCGNLCGAVLRGAVIRDADLRNADLRGAVLRDAVLRGADLRDAVLREADLREADLRGADLHGADLCGADLRGAVIRVADLREADLRNADLCGADLRDAVLRGADLRDAVLGGADLHGADLCGARYTTEQLLHVSWGELPPELCLAAMRLDAAGHPDPAAFDRWAADGPCPYTAKYEGAQRAVNFRPHRELWEPGPAPDPEWLLAHLAALRGVRL